MAGDIGRNKVLENYINDLIGKGYKKKDIKKKLLEGGYDSLIVNKYLYPYASVLMIAGIILVVMIVVFVSVAAYFIISDGTNGGGDGVEAGDGGPESTAPDIVPEDIVPESICRRYLENPERYVDRPDYAETIEACDDVELEEAFDCSIIEDEVWQERCIEEVEDLGYFRSEDTWIRVAENEGS